MKKGEAKIEFYSNLKYLKQEFESGLVISKFLYEKAKLEKNFKMTYKQFNKYFNDELKNTRNQIEMAQISKNQDKTINDIEKDIKQKNEPIKLYVNTKNGRIFNPLYGKSVNNDDIL
ncbi:hypothetical protein CFT13S00388_09230 [Campylobacter fetus subsp. testudinum]|uniref:hypothetical protein n=1 Tax=Campylobacter fetus TaxID=196 RepID=UPI000818B920|nr:hypothetical protein [Campylobacter fetus]OCR86419.1 hypothetical protein CFT13S00388_09230 [Campylobacter fetus subsp. testudinum]